MPTDWVTVSGVLTNLTSGLDIGCGYAPYSKYGGKTATDILKQVDKVLQSANTVLENHRDLIPPDDFQELKRTYCRYHWKMTNESQEDRATTDRLIRQSRILSQLYSKRQPHVDRARNLLRQVETYQTRVLAASRNAQPPDTLTLFEDEIDAAAATEQSLSGDGSSYTSWFSAFGRSSRSESISTTGSESTRVELGTVTPHKVEDHGFAITVTHFPKHKSEPTEVDDEMVVGMGKKIYRRMISFENSEKRIEIIDPKLYALDSNETYIPEETLRAMSTLGQSLLNQSDSGIPEGANVVTESQASLSVGATIEKLKKMTMDVSE